MVNEEENMHVLENTWVLSEQYYIDNKLDRCKGYENSFEKLCIIGTIEMFWSYWRVLPTISYRISLVCLFYRDVFYNGNERIVEKVNSKNPNDPPRKVRVFCFFV